MRVALEGRTGVKVEGVQEDERDAITNWMQARNEKREDSRRLHVSDDSDSNIKPSRYGIQ
jgi:hypothetical protein